MTTHRQDILSKAIEITCGERSAVYGPPGQDFARTASLLNALGFTRNGRPLRPSDVAAIMVCVKLSRLCHTPNHKDSWVDIAGYAACGAECEWENESGGQ